jgi:hypothetical protein
MSSNSLPGLRTELAELQREIRQLQERASRLEAKVRELEEGEFELISSAPSERDSARVSGEVATADTAGRIALAQQIGRFLLRCLSGEFRGTSGRERLKLQNRYYIVCADFNGRRLPDPLFVDNFASVKHLCKRGPSAGDSIFVGVATKWEAKLVFEASGFRIPDELRDA